MRTTTLHSCPPSHPSQFPLEMGDVSLSTSTLLTLVSYVFYAGSVLKRFSFSHSVCMYEKYLQFTTRRFIANLNATDVLKLLFLCKKCIQSISLVYLILSVFVIKQLPAIYNYTVYC